MGKRIEEASQYCGVPCDLIVHFIDEEWIRPMDLEARILDDEDLARIDLIWDLTERLGVNEEGVPIILHLIDQLNRFHLELTRDRD